MQHVNLQGWNITVAKTTIMVPSSEGNGEPVPAEGWVLVFTEMVPRSGNTLRYECGRDVRDYIVRELTGGIVLHGGDLPRI